MMALKPEALAEAPVELQIEKVTLSEQKRANARDRDGLTERKQYCIYGLFSNLLITFVFSCISCLICIFPL